MKKWFWALGWVLTASPLFASESQFGYMYTTDLLPKGQTEIEQWLTWRHGRSQGDMNVLEGRTEFELGVTDNFQAAFYAHYAYLSAFHNNVDDTTAPPEVFAELQPGPDDHMDNLKFVGASLEGIYRILSPYTDGLGLALYCEPLGGQGLIEVESRIILQKNFLDDTLVFVLNATVEQELRDLPGDPDADPGSEEAAQHWDKETDMNYGLGISYRFIPEWSLGVEFQNEQEFAGLTPFTDPTNLAFYLGPNLHYGGKDGFVTVTFLAQLPWSADYANPAPGFVVNGITNADDFENMRVRIKAGIYL